MGEKVSFTGVENERVQDEAEACSERAVALLESRVSDMIVVEERSSRSEMAHLTHLLAAAVSVFWRDLNFLGLRTPPWHWRGVLPIRLCSGQRAHTNHRRRFTPDCHFAEAQQQRHRSHLPTHSINDKYLDFPLAEARTGQFS